MKADSTGFTPVKLIFLGPTNTGKTSIIHRLVYDDCPVLHDITIAIDFYIKVLIVQNTKCKIELWDTYGVFSGRNQAIGYAKKANAAVFVFDVSNKSSLNELVYYISEYKKQCQSEKKNFYGILLGNKADKNKSVSLVEAEKFASEYGMDYFEVSSKSDDNYLTISEALGSISKKFLVGEGIINEFETESESVRNNQYIKESIHNTINVFVDSITKLFPFNEFIISLVSEMNEFFKDNISGVKKFNTFEDLKDIIGNLGALKEKILNLLKMSGMSIYSTELIAKKKKKNQLENEKLLNDFFSSNNIIRDAIGTCIYKYIITFIRKFLSKGPEEKNLMILRDRNDDVLESLNNRKRELLTFFSEEYIKYRTSMDLHDYFQFKIHICLIFEGRENGILSKIKGKEIEFYSKKGKEMMKILKQYRYAFNDKWNKVTMKDMTNNPFELEEKINFYGYKSFLSYKTAYQFADMDIKHINEQVHLRIDAAYVYYLMGYFLKANFYILASNLIIFKNRNLINQKEVDYVIKIGNKISRGIYEDNDLFGEFNTKDKNSANSSLDQNSTSGPSNINSELRKIQFSSDKLNNKKEDEQKMHIKDLKNKIYKNIFLGLSYQNKEFSIVTQTEEDIGKNRHNSKRISSSSLGATVTPNQRKMGKYLAFLVIPGLVAYGLVKLADKIQNSKQLKKYQAISDRLFQIYSKAISFFRRKQYLAFLEALGEKYEGNKTLIQSNIKKNIIEVEPVEICNVLLKYGFKPDDIANLLNLIGVSLISLCSDGPKNISNEATFKRNRKLAIKIFKVGLTENLVQAAKEIDRNLREKIQLGINERPFLDSIENIRNCIRINLVMLLILKDKDGTKDYIRDVERTIKKQSFYPINEQLEVSKDLILALYGNEFDEKFSIFYQEIRNVSQNFAKLQDNKIHHISLYGIGTIFLDDYVVFNTITNGKFYLSKESFIEAFSTSCQKAKKEQCNYYLEVLKNGNLFSINEWKIKFKNEGKLFSYEYLEFLSKYFNIKINLFVTAELEINCKKTPCYVFDSCIDFGDSKSPMYSVVHLVMKKEKETITITHAFVPFSPIDDDAGAQVNFMKDHEKFNYECASQTYFNLFKFYEKNPTEKKINSAYDKVLLKLSLHKEILKFILSDKTKTPVQLKLLSIAERKLGNYQNCINYMKMFLKKSKEEDPLITESFLMKVMQEKKMDKDYVKYYRNVFEENRTKVPLKGPSKVGYKVLSLDGGGIRCLIQLMILCEIEKITNKPISSLFDHVIGTSTGAIIAAALCLEDQNKLPLFRAHELLETILDGKDFLYWEESLDNKELYNHKYSLSKKKQFFKRIFSDRKINNSLTNLAITTYNITKKKIELFTSYQNKRYNTSNISNTICDILEIATASPSMFPVSKQKGSDFCDGSLLAYDPSVHGINEVLGEGLALSDIKLLSIGTGYYPLLPREVLWYNLDGKKGEGNLENYTAHVRALLSKESNVYYKLQVLLPTPVEIDNVSAFNELLDYSREYLLEMEREDKLNEIIEKVIY